MHPNYQFLIEKIRAAQMGFRVLDFGCGGGIFVKEACTNGLDCHGADIFYHDGAGRKEADESGLLGNRVREIREGQLPFPDGHFDFVVSNFVFEHVENLAGALSEIHRTLRPGGKLLALYPTQSTIREGHVDMPLVHRMKPGRFRERYVLALRHLGFGREKSEQLTPWEWTIAKLYGIDQLTFYRTHDEIVDLLQTADFSAAFIEDEFMRFRLRRRVPFARQVSRLMGATVLEATKH